MGTSSTEKPRWEMVNVTLRRKFDGIVTLHELKELKETKGQLADMVLLKKSRWVWLM